MLRRWGALLLAVAFVLSAGPARADSFSELGHEPWIGSEKTGEKAEKKNTKKSTRKHRRRRTVNHPKKAGPKAAKPKTTQPVATKAASPKAESKTANTPEKKLEKKTGVIALPAPKPDVMTTASLPPVTHGGIPAGEWLKVQSALLWSGDYAKIGKDEEPLQGAVKNFQRRQKAKVTGILTIEQRAALLAAGDRYERRYGWRVVTDPATGIRIGLPAKLAPTAHDAAHGTRWSSPHGEVQVETFRLKDPDLKLADFFAQEKKNPQTRRVSRSTLHNDDFSIHGMQGLKYFDVHAQKRDGEIRGFTVLYDQAMRGIVEPVAEAMAAAFEPFPARNMPFAVLAKPVEYGTGLIVSPRGDIVTDYDVTDGCKVIVANGLGNAELVAEDKTKGLALLRVYGQRNLPALALPEENAAAKAVTLIGIPDPKEQHGAHHPKEIKARLAGGDAIRLSQPVPMAGFSGAAVLDETGRVLGMMETRNAVLASNGPPIAPVHLVTATTIRSFLKAHDVAPATGGNARDAVVRMICIRK
jgi:hypothetical protein